MRPVANHPKITPISSPHKNPILNRKPACSCGGTCPKCQTEQNIQAKLKIGAPNDKYEQEADRVADQVMRMPEPTIQRETMPSEEGDEELAVQAKLISNQVSSLVQRMTTENGVDEEEIAQRKTSLSASTNAPSSTHRDIQSLRGGGQPLPKTQRNFFESCIGADFSRVRVHNDARAARAAQSVNARAFTLGHDVVFGAGEYSPDTSSGRKLLAHELTHVVQQSSGEIGNNSSALIQRQFEKLPQPPPPPDFECSIDLITLAKLIAGDKQAALKVINCCVSDLPVVGRGCTKDVVAAACKIFPALCEKKKADKKQPTCPFGFKPGSGNFKGKCCKADKVLETSEHCCDTNQMTSFALFPKCCPPPSVPNAEKKECVLPQVGPCPPDRETPMFDDKLLGRFTCICQPESRQNTQKRTCCPSGQVGTSGECKTPEKEKKQTPPPPPPAIPAPSPIEVLFNKELPLPGWKGSGGLGSWVVTTSLTAEGEAGYSKLLEQLKTQKNLRVELIGKASPEGEPDFNKKLAARRATMILEALVSDGVERSQIANALDNGEAGCEKISGNPGLVTCGESGAKGVRDRQVLARFFIP